MNQKINHRKPIPPIIINVDSHPYFSDKTGTVNGAKIAPILLPELKIPVAKARSF